MSNEPSFGEKQWRLIRAWVRANKDRIRNRLASHDLAGVEKLAREEINGANPTASQVEQVLRSIGG